MTEISIKESLRIAFDKFYHELNFQNIHLEPNFNNQLKSLEASCLEILDNKHTKEYEEWHEDGYNQGQDYGYENGFSDGEVEGYSRGFEDGAQEKCNECTQ